MRKNWMNFGVFFCLELVVQNHAPYHFGIGCQPWIWIDGLFWGLLVDVYSLS